MAENLCKICTAKHVGCHSKCSSYQAWRAELEEKRRKVYREKAKENRVTRYMIDQPEKMKRSKSTNGVMRNHKK